MKQINENVNGDPKGDVPVIHSDSGHSFEGVFDGTNRCIFYVDDYVTGGGNLVWSQGDVRLIFPADPGSYEGSQLNPPLPTIEYTSVTPYPPIPSRAEVLSVNMHFLGGLVVDSPVYGKMPWWDSCLSWCDPATRANAYVVKRAAADSHAIIHIPSGDPLYNEYGQFYSPDKFGALDWTNGLTALDSRFTDLVDEVIRAGFKFIILMDENEQKSPKIVKLVMQALSDLQVQYGFAMPGYDGVFYVWQNESIMAWAAGARAIKLNCYLGLEHPPGKIPLGEGGQDYQPGGRMKDFDIVLGEFNSDLQQDSTWQILGRMIKPYYRPPNQQGDPNPPFYLVDCSRGPRFYNCFESDYPYYWVRVNINDPASVSWMQSDINYERTYFRSLGAKYTG